MFKVGDIIVYCGDLYPGYEYKYRDGRDLEVTCVIRNSVYIKCIQTGEEWHGLDKRVFTLEPFQLEND